MRTYDRDLTDEPVAYLITFRCYGTWLHGDHRKPERVMIALKAWVTRMLREAGHVEADRSVWSRHGSTRYLWNEEQLGHAVAYVVEGHALPPSIGTSG